MYLKNALKSKTGLCTIADKLADLSETDVSCKQQLGCICNIYMHACICQDIACMIKQ